MKAVKNPVCIVPHRAHYSLFTHGLDHYFLKSLGHILFNDKFTVLL